MVSVIRKHKSSNPTYQNISDAMQDNEGCVFITLEEIPNIKTWGELPLGYVVVSEI